MKKRNVFSNPDIQMHTSTMKGTEDTYITYIHIHDRLDINARGHVFGNIICLRAEICLLSQTETYASVKKSIIGEDSAEREGRVSVS